MSEIIYILRTFPYSANRFCIFNVSAGNIKSAPAARVPGSAGTASTVGVLSGIAGVPVTVDAVDSAAAETLCNTRNVPVQNPSSLRFRVSRRLSLSCCNCICVTAAVYLGFKSALCTSAVFFPFAWRILPAIAVHSSVTKIINCIALSGMSVFFIILTVFPLLFAILCV